MIKKSKMNTNFMIEKLMGRENYPNWKFAMQTFLEHEELWDAVLGTEDDAKKVTKARTKIILSIDPINYAHVQDCKDAKSVWESLEKVFDDSGLYRKIGLLRSLISTRLDTCKSVEEFVNTIITTAHKLNGIGFKVNDEWVGCIMLAGLTDEYKPMIMGIENCGMEITGDEIKTRILQDVKIEDKQSNALIAKKGPSNKYRGNAKTTLRCFNCNEVGHFSKDCPKKMKYKSKKKSMCAVLNTGSFVDPHDWYFDSGATCHMTKHRSWIKDMKNVEDSVNIANNLQIRVDGIGHCEVQANNGSFQQELDIKEVSFVPDLSTNLLSVSKITEKGNTVIFTKSKCEVLDPTNEVIATGSIENGLYKLCRSKQNCLISGKELWHRRLGHINESSMNQMKNGTADGIEYKNENLRDCFPCAEGKQHREVFPKHVPSKSRSENLLDRIHSDVCGPMEVASFGGSRYVVTFIDDASRKVFVDFLSHKNQVLKAFKRFKSLVENQCGRKIKRFRSDNGTEYTSKDFQKFLEESGIVHEKTVPYTPEQNGLAERMNRTIVEKAKCMLFDAALKKGFWAEAINTAVYIINRLPTKSNLKSPEEMWTGKKPDVSHFRIFGTEVMMHIPKEKRRKWDKKAEKGIFMGYELDTKGYRIYSLSKKHVVIRRDVKFMNEGENSTIEDNFKKKSSFIQLSEILNSSDENENSNGQVPVISDEAGEMEQFDEVGDVERLSENASNSEQESSENEEFEDANNQTLSSDEEIIEPEIPAVPTPRRSSRARTKITKYTYLSVNNLPDPETYEEVLRRPDKDLWIKAMQEEVESLKKNETWDLVDVPPDRKAIKSKWVFKTKRNESGKIERYKARLVIKGCSQKKGIDYNETYAPVVRYSSIRYLIALAVKYDLKIHQMDAVTAYLQGELNDEEIYMSQPEGFEQKGSKVCRLKKALYGLKQSGRVWNKKLDGVLKGLGFKVSQFDPCIYFKIQEGVILIVAVYVDDFLIFSNDDSTVKDLKIQLMDVFDMKDLGEAKHCLGIRITRTKKSIALDQQQYIEEILKKFKMSDCNPISTPMDPNQKLSKNENGTKTDKPYRELIGSVMFLVQCTRPDLAYVVSSLSRFNNSPSEEHWTAAKRLLRYLKGTIDNKLIFNKDGNSEIIGYSDASWANDSEDRRSVTGYAFKLQGGTISWNAKRQPTIALSSNEAEYMAISATTQEAMWWKGFVNEIECTDKPIEIHSDSQSAICLAENGNYSQRTKHIDVRHHFIREKIANKQIKLKYLSTANQVADIFTKALNSDKIQYFKKAMGLISN